MNPLPVSRMPPDPPSRGSMEEFPQDFKPFVPTDPLPSQRQLQVANPSNGGGPPRKDKSHLQELLTKLDQPDTMINLDDIIVTSQLKTADEVVKEFNHHRSSIMVKSPVGTRILPDEYRLVALNRNPELVPFTNYPMRKQVFPSPNDETEELGTFKQTTLCFGNYGHYVVNVPIGKLALAWKGLTPIILAQGIHVIHDSNFKTVTQENIVNVGDPYIKHGTYHIFRVPPGFIAKITIGTSPYLLGHRTEPYIFNHPVFSLVQPFTPLTDAWINHGNYNILQVPFGKIAKVWLGSKPSILEAREEPYFFSDPSFRLVMNQEKTYFTNASDQIIVHGSLKRIMPRTGEVAITYDNGRLVIYQPTTTHDPIVITNVNHVFDSFIPINTQTIEFPTEKTKNQRRKENPNDIEGSNYEVFRTNDGLPIGVKLLVVYEIDNPAETLKKLSPDKILPHIESIVTADMGMVIQNCSSTDFLKSNQTQAHPIVKPVDDPLVPSAPPFFRHLQDEVKNQLCDDFAKYGIKLIRLNIETPKVLDQKISSEMARFSLMSTEASAKEAVMERNANISRQTATIEAKQKEIAQNQENSNIMSKAQTEMNAAKLRAEAKWIEAETENKIKEMAINIEKQRAELYQLYPELLQKDLAELQVRSMNGVEKMIISPDVASMYFGMNYGMNLNMRTAPQAPTFSASNVVIDKKI
jgi:regulator of protease activity HflC (stomatin/prohibitin superfamily)